MGYALWQAVQLGAPPELNIASPQQYQIFNTNPISISGEVDGDVSVLVGGDPVTVDEQNMFEAEVYLQDGYNVVDVTAVNNFSRERTIQLTLYLNSDEETISVVDEQG